MHCDHQLINDHLLDYIEQRLTPELSRQLDQAISNCETCQASYRQALELNQLAHQWQQQPVPEWHRTRYAVQPRHQTSNWLSWSALATSTIALLCVLFQVQLTSNTQGFQLSFGAPDTSHLESLLERKFDEYNKQQSVMLDARFIAHTDKQASTNRLMLADWMEKNRDERRDELNFIITGLQTQRFEDQNKYEKRMAYLVENQIENNQYINQLIQSDKFAVGDK